MNKTKIEWADSTWNPVTGCKHGCSYCYARKIAQRFEGFDQTENKTWNLMYENGSELAVLDGMQAKRTNEGEVITAPYPFGFMPTLHRYRLVEPQLEKNPKKIFVCSMADLFGNWVPDSWIEEVFNACLAAPQHTYLFLTKNPWRYLSLDKFRRLPYQDNFWYGSTVTKDDTPAFASSRYNCFISVEPLLGKFESNEIESLDGIKWIVTGAMTGPGSKKYQPPKMWIDSIVDIARQSEIPIFMKDSLQTAWGGPLMRETPWDKEG